MKSKTAESTGENTKIKIFIVKFICDQVLVKAKILIVNQYWLDS